MTKLVAPPLILKADYSFIIYINFYSKMTKINFFLINKENVGRRLDNFLFSNFKKGIPKSKIYSSIRKAKIKVNGRKTKPDYKLIVCLLYTSPSPRDLTASRMPSSA